ncbi:MAG: SpoIID/LytB domain-containing protein [Myxococcales bacterium]
MIGRRGFLASCAGTIAAARSVLASGGAPDAGVTDLFAGAPAPDDPLEFLYSRRLAFDEGQPLITVRVAEGRREAVVQPRGPLQADARSETGSPQLAVEAGAEGRWSVRLVAGRPGVGAAWVQLEEVRYGDRDGLARARSTWDSREVKTRVTTVGQVYGIAGHVVDTRKYAVLAEGDATDAGARAQAEQIAARFEGTRPQILRELASRPTGRIELLDPEGKVRAVGQGAIELRAKAGLVVPEVEFGMGYAFHGYESRTYPGRLYAAVDAAGTLALIAAVPMERLVKGVVPSEIFANAHAEALKAQAVTARGEVLAKVGARHLGDPYLLCAEQHCQVYRGVGAETGATDRAVDATHGEALFARVPAKGVLGALAQGHVSRLVDSVYSAVCGGFTENNDAVWGGPPDPSLRGRPDFDARDPGMARYADGIGAALVSRFVHLGKIPSYCALSGLARPEKVRWKRTFSQAEVDELCAPLKVGPVRSLAVEGRGISGRARALRVEGSGGVARVVSELSIRRMFRNLNSGMFVIERSGGDYSFVGGGWGHGSGMCQLGAIGRAQRGWDYSRILGWYYSGARPERIY